MALVKGCLLLGDQDGNLRLEKFDGSAFSTLFSLDLGDRPVTGLVPRPRGNLLVATDGRLTLHATGLVKRLWHTDDYGPGTGRRALSVLPDKTLVTCGKYGVFAFRER